MEPRVPSAHYARREMKLSLTCSCTAQRQRGHATEPTIASPTHCHDRRDRAQRRSVQRSSVGSGVCEGHRVPPLLHPPHRGNLLCGQQQPPLRRHRAGRSAE
eukprot:968918-Rhodomonas_salina.4